jgi:hypothetical protein
MNKKTYRFKISGLPKDKEFELMPFGRQIEHFKSIEAFKQSAKKGWVSMKRISSAKAVKEAIKLYEAKEYYCVFYDCPNYRDDSFEFWYKGE